jgi:WD domain, G-beta repeat./3-carboxy-cis,cis-muconate lactonizing enzyme.
MHTLTKINQPIACLIHAENLTFSPDGTLLALCSDLPLAGIRLYTVDPINHLIDPQPICTIKSNELIHNVRFSSDGRYIATASFDTKTSLSVYKIITHPTISLQCVYNQASPFPRHKSKAINFTRDNKFIIIGYSAPLSDNKYSLMKNIVRVYEFNALNGTLGALVCHCEESHHGTLEDIAFLPYDSGIILSDQSNDGLTIYAFDSSTGIIDTQALFIKNPEAQLQFPHGLAVSPHNDFLAVCNYGDDKVTIYAITQTPPLQ